MQKKRIVILGSTGSIGRHTLEVISAFPDRFEVTGLAAGKEIDILEQQIKQYHPKIVALSEGAEELKKRLQGENVQIFSGEEGVTEVARYQETDLVLSAIVGASSLVPLLAAIRSGKTIALASKEAIVMAGKLIRQEAEKTGVTLLPVDSEPNAIFQCLEGNQRKEIKKLLLTASGGPFYNCDRDSLSAVTPADALNHPVWNMGRKITIDSATLMNKGLEIIEASRFFDIDISRIEVVIHPQAKIHSLVEFIDGSVMALMGITDMRIPIQHTLTYPDRISNNLPAFDLVNSSPLTFQTPDTDKFPCLRYAYQAGTTGGTMPTVLNAANEVAVETFLAGNINFLDIAEISRQVMAAHQTLPGDNLDEILKTDFWAREEAKKIIGRLKK